MSYVVVVGDLLFRFVNFYCITAAFLLFRVNSIASQSHTGGGISTLRLFLIRNMVCRTEERSFVAIGG